MQSISDSLLRFWIWNVLINQFVCFKLTRTSFNKNWVYHVLRYELIWPNIYIFFWNSRFIHNSSLLVIMCKSFVWLCNIVQIKKIVWNVMEIISFLNIKNFYFILHLFYLMFLHIFITLPIFSLISLTLSISH